MNEQQSINALTILYQLYADQLSEELGQEICVEVEVHEKR